LKCRIQSRWRKAVVYRKMRKTQTLRMNMAGNEYNKTEVNFT
jgi:hypothetical protein